MVEHNKYEAFLFLLQLTAHTGMTDTALHQTLRRTVKHILRNVMKSNATSSIKTVCNRSSLHAHTWASYSTLQQ